MILKNTTYNSIASIYDEIMASVDYQGWVNYVEALVSLHNGSFNSVLDLACGTGSSTIPFARRGKLTTGIDLSTAMIKIAQNKIKGETLHNLRFLQSDLCRLKLQESFDLAVLFQDGLNYLIGTERLASAFKNIHTILNPEGFFVFDLTRPRLRPLSGEKNSEVAEDDQFTFFWESNFNYETNIWSIKLIIFRLVENGLYKKYYEEHQEQDYPPGLVSELLKKCGFTVLGIYPSFSLEPIKNDEESEAKLTFVTRRIGE